MVKKAVVALTAMVLCVSLCGCFGNAADPNASRLQALYGENAEIAAEYDRILAAVCSNGVFVGKASDGVISFKGVPYAKPPVGELRWKAPEEPEESSRVFEAYYFGKSPIQTEWPSEPGSYYPQGENCLTLNVWTNTRNASKNKTVMVFFHGGSYGWGATSDPIYDGHNLVSKFDDLILVTVEYRLGLLGFIDFSSVPGGEAYADSGNLGLLDQICALQWIQKNISAFGGDPKNVTIFGESAGAGSVSLLPLIDVSKGLFQRIIAESGSVALTYSREECQNLTALLLKETGCKTVDELKQLSEEELIAVNEKLNDYNNFPERDGVVLPEDLYACYADGQSAEVDLLIGTNADEARYWINEMGYYVPGVSGLLIYKHGLPVMFENNLRKLSAEEKELVQAFQNLQSEKKIWKITELYNELLFRVPAMKQAELHALNGGKAYAYYWTYPGADQTVGACHAIELAYVFNNPQETIYTGGKYNEALADAAQEMWVNFARTGDPSTAQHEWLPYDANTRMTMVLGDEIRMKSDLKKEQRELLTPLLHHYFNGCYAQMDLNVPQTYRIAAQLLGTILLGVCLVILLTAPVRVKKHKRRR